MYRFVVTLMLLALPATASAQTVSLSQEQAVERAVARHPLIKASDFGARAAEARVKQARTGWLPRIQIQGGYQFVGPQQRLNITQNVDILPEPITITRNIGSLHNASIGVTVAWRAYDFGARDVLASQAKAAAAAARAEGRERAAQVAYAVRASYLAALFFQEMQAVTQRSLQVAKKEQRDERVKKQAGVGSDLDLARIDSRVAELSARVTRARQERERALTTLRILLGLKPGTRLRLTDSLQRLATAAPSAAPDAKRNPTRVKLDALRQAAQLQLKRQWRSYWPTLDVVGNFKYQYPKNYFETDKGGIAYMAGVMLTWNVFDGDLLRRQRAESRAKIRQVKSLQKANDEDIQRKLADAAAQVRIADASAVAARKMRRAARVYVKAARVSKRAGTGTALEVRKAEEALDGAQLAEVKAWFDGALARANRLQAEGIAALRNDR